jgi:hypothetical protein
LLKSDRNASLSCEILPTALRASSITDNILAANKALSHALRIDQLLIVVAVTMADGEDGCRSMEIQRLRAFTKTLEKVSANSTKAMQVRLVNMTETGLTTLRTFKPTFTYPIFGDSETIFGYKDLKIDLQYNASDMRPHVQVAFGRKFKQIGGEEPVDIEATLRDFLPEGMPL